MKVKFNFANAMTAADCIVGGDLGIAVLCKVKQAKWHLTDIKGFILFTGNTRKSCLEELERLIVQGKADEAAAEAAAANSIANAQERIAKGGEAAGKLRKSIVEV